MGIQVVRTILLLMAISAPAAPAQLPFVPIPAAAAPRYQFDLRRNFFTSSETADADRRGLMAAAARVRPSIAGSRTGADLLRLLRSIDSLMRGTGRQYAYLSLRGLIDANDTDAQRDFNELAAAAEPVFAEADRFLGGIGAVRFDSMARAHPALARYRYAAERARRGAAHRLAPAAERDLIPLDAEAAGWGPRLFRSTVANIVWEPVNTPEEQLDLRRNGNQIRSHPDRSVRERGYRLNEKGLISKLDTFGLILTRQAALRDSAARMRRWPDYPAQAYAGNELTPAFIRSLLQAILARAELNREYERGQIARVAATLGVDTVHMWDLTAPDPGTAAPRFTIREATDAILASVAPLGDPYVREMRRLLDPANGRLDLIARPGRVDRPGFSTGSVGYPSTFFQGRFEGYIDDVLILAHEAGHAVQNVLMDSAGVLPRHAWGPSFFTESFATLNELLLLHHLQRTGTAAAERAFFRRRQIENALELFRTAYESSFELKLFDSVAAGRPMDAAALEAMMQATASQASLWFGPNSERRYAWLQPIQFFTWPLYRVNYTIAKLLALQYYRIMLSDPSTFAVRYGRLLSNGYDATPDELLRRHLGIDLANPAALVEGSLGVISNRLIGSVRR